MVEYRIEFDESRTSNLKTYENLIKILAEKGDLREIISGERYYWASKNDEEGLIRMLTEFSGVSITRLSGKLLR
jgi:hypothetical protein